MIKVLHIVPALDGGGVENLLLNYYTHMDKNEFKFDFIVYGKKKGALESTFEKLGSTIFHIPPRHGALFASLKQMKKIICSKNYDIIHAHQNKMSFIPLFYAKRQGIKVRIAHSHIAYEIENIINKTERKILSIFTRHYATDWFACGIDAGIWIYGKRAVKKGKVHIMKNAIDIHKFVFNQDTRSKVRKELGLEKKFVVANIGRFTYQKNHEFLIKIFKEIYMNNKDAVLLLIGNGEFEHGLKEQVKKYGLNDSVKFLGVCNDVPKLLQAIDVFVLPSRYEGLPVVLVEAQSAGLKSIVADTITKEVRVTDLVTYMSLEECYSIWSSEILKFSKGYERTNTYTKMQLGGYDIKQQAKELQCFYEKIIRFK